MTPPATPPSPFGRWAVPLGLVAVLIAAVVARVAWIDERSVWFDEAYTWQMCRNTDAEIVDRLRYDNNPPLYYLALRHWMTAFGESPAALRSISVMAGLAAVVGTFLLMRQLLRGVGGREERWVPVLAAAFVALNPMSVRYGCEARMYALAQALAVFTVWACVRAMQSDQRWGRWLLVAAFATAFAYTHTFAVLTLLFLGAAVVWYQVAIARRFLPLSAAAFGLVGVAFLPWLPALLDQIKNGETRGWIPPIDAAQLLATPYLMFADPEGVPPLMGSIPVAVAAAVVALGGVWRRTWMDGLLLALGGGPILAVIVLCIVGIPAYLARYFVFGVPFLLGLLAVTLAKAPGRWLFPIFPVVAIAVHGWWCLDAWRHLAIPYRPGYRGLADEIARRGEADDLVICADGRCYFPIRYQLRGRANVYALAPERNGVYGGAALTNPDDAFLPLPDLLRRATGRVWVVNAVWDGKISHPVAVPPEWQPVSQVFLDEPLGDEGVALMEYRTR